MLAAARNGAGSNVTACTSSITPMAEAKPPPSECPVSTMLLPAIAGFCLSRTTNSAACLSWSVSLPPPSGTLLSNMSGFSSPSKYVPAKLTTTSLPFTYAAASKPVVLSCQ